MRKNQEHVDYEHVLGTTLQTKTFMPKVWPKNSTPLIYVDNEDDQEVLHQCRLTTASC